MLTMSTLKDRIDEIQTALGWNNQEMADYAGVSRSAVAQWKGQGSKIIHTIGRVDVAEKLSRASGYSAMWIARGEGPKKITPQSTDQWPLPLISLDKINSLSTEDLIRLESAILISASHIGLDIKS